MQEDLRLQRLSRRKEEMLKSEMKECSFKPQIDALSQEIAKDGGNRRRQNLLEEMNPGVIFNNGQ